MKFSRSLSALLLPAMAVVCVSASRARAADSTAVAPERVENGVVVSGPRAGLPPIGNIVGQAAGAQAAAPAPTPPAPAAPDKPTKSVDIVPLEAAVRADSLNASKHFLLGNGYYDQGRLNEALAQFERAVELDSTYWKAWVNIGTVQDELSRSSVAVRAFSKAIELHPGDTFAYVKLANLEYADGNALAAMDNYRKALEIDPHCLEARFMLGNAFAEQEMYREAIHQWKMVLASSPNAPEAKMARDNIETVYAFFGEQPDYLRELKSLDGAAAPPAPRHGEEPAKRHIKAAGSGAKAEAQVHTKTSGS